MTARKHEHEHEREREREHERVCTGGVKLLPIEMPPLGAPAYGLSHSPPLMPRLQTFLYTRSCSCTCSCSSSRHASGAGAPSALAC